MSYSQKIKDAHDLLHSKDYCYTDKRGWLDFPAQITDHDIKNIQNFSEIISKKCDILIIIGIGGSYLGIRAALEFLKSCHYLWIKEWLLDNYCLHLDLNKFRESGMTLQLTVFEDLNLAFLYSDEFKERLEEIVTSRDIVIEYICE